MSLLLGVVSVDSAQPIAAAVECTIPGPISAPRDASPSPELRESATPISADEATPVSTRDLLKAGLEHLVRVVAECKSDGNFQTMSQLVSEKYLGQVYGGGPRMSRATFLALAGALPTPRIRFRDFDDLSMIGPREARANVKLIVGNQLIAERLTFVEEEHRPGNWLIDSTAPLQVQPPRDHDELRLTITGNRYNPDVLTAANSTVDIKVDNADKEDHELLVLRLAEGATTDQLLIDRGPDLPVGITYLGQVTIPARSTGNLVLVDLHPGDYAIVDLLPTDNGIPHLSVGMKATLTISGE